MSAREEAESFLRKAEEDLRAIRAMVSAEDFTDAIFGFHAQQAVEKLLKAWLRSTGVDPPRTHDLDFLFALIERGGSAIPDCLAVLRDLSDFAVMFRYETLELQRPVDREDVAQQVETLAERVRAAVRVP